MRTKKSKVKLIPLGGLGEIGKLQLSMKMK